MFLPAFATLVLAAAIGTAIIVQNQAQTDRIAEADRTADRFVSEVGLFRSVVVEAINGSGEDDPGELVKVLDAATAKRPVLGQASTDGAERSAAYADAQRIQETLLDPYRDLRRELRRADLALDFIAACYEALGHKVSDYVGFGGVSSSRPIREKLIPAFVRAREEFEAARVPRGQQKLADRVVGALQYVIDQSTLLADRIDANRNYSFNYGDQFDRAAGAVGDYAATVKGDLLEAINAVAVTR